MAIATVADATARLGRPATPEEETALAARLDDAEAALVVRIRDLVAQVTAAPDGWLAQAVVSVECEIALRAAGLAARITNVQPGAGSIVELPDNRPGVVFVRSEEWRRLGIFPLQVWNPYPSAADLQDPETGLWADWGWAPGEGWGDGSV